MWLDSSPLLGQKTVLLQAHKSFIIAPVTSQFYAVFSPNQTSALEKNTYCTSKWKTLVVKQASEHTCSVVALAKMEVFMRSSTLLVTTYKNSSNRKNNPYFTVLLKMYFLCYQNVSKYDRTKSRYSLFFFFTELWITNIFLSISSENI